MKHFTKCLMIFLLITNSLFLSAKCRHYCGVKYETEYGWSKSYKIEVQFLTGMELNNATGSFKYSGYSNYAVIFWGQGEASIIKLSSYLACGYEVDCECIENTYGDLKGTDLQGIAWKICTSEYCY